MATSIKQIIQEMSSAQMPRVILGTVIDTEPIKINLLNDPNVTLTEVSLTIPQRLSPLAKGKQYYLLSTDNNKTYYVLDRNWDWPRIVIGTVVSAAPEITLQDDPEITIGADKITVPPRLSPLTVGKPYFIIVTNYNKPYYVLDRNWDWDCKEECKCPWQMKS